jgi:hypothetical protein
MNRAKCCSMYILELFSYEKPHSRDCKWDGSLLHLISLGKFPLQSFWTSWLGCMNEEIVLSIQKNHLWWNFFLHWEKNSVENNVVVISLGKNFPVFVLKIEIKFFYCKDAIWCTGKEYIWLSRYQETGTIEYIVYEEVY